MRIDIISVVPEIMESPFAYSIMKRAIDKQLVEVHFHNLHDYANNAYRQVDDYQFGGGAGMVLMIEPIDKCISALKAERDYDEVIFLTPDGNTLQQKMANQLSLAENIIILYSAMQLFVSSLVFSPTKLQPLLIRFKTIC